VRFPSAAQPHQKERETCDLTWFMVNRFGNYLGQGTFAARLNGNRRSQLGVRRWHVTHSDADAQTRTERATDDFANLFCVGSVLQMA